MSNSMAGAPRTEHSEARLTTNLRWNNGVLEQAWAVTNYRGGIAQSQETDWRPVPETTDD